MITSEILEQLNESTFIGRSRIDGYPMYKIHLGNRPHTKGLNTFNVKYNEADKINPIILIKEIEHVKEYQSIALKMKI